jgi:hypothetical protein
MDVAAKTGVNKQLHYDISKSTKKFFMTERVSSISDSLEYCPGKVLATLLIINNQGKAKGSRILNYVLILNT